MKVNGVISLIFVLAAAVMGQSSLADLAPGHAGAVKKFLAINGQYSFMPEEVIDADYLQDMRRSLKVQKPYYAVGDLNRDGINDFAVILRRKGKPIDNGEPLAATHRYDHPLGIVIFNGLGRGGFKKAFIEDVNVPFVCFLKIDISKGRRQLYFGVFETDADTVIFTPTGQGYAAKYPDAP